MEFGDNYIGTTTAAAPEGLTAHIFTMVNQNIVGDALEYWWSTHINYFIWFYFIIKWYQDYLQNTIWLRTNGQNRTIEII